MSRETNQAVLIYCKFCKSKHEIIVRETDYLDWVKGKLIQLAFPYLLPDQRELLISKTCGKCFDEMFKECD